MKDKNIYIGGAIIIALIIGIWAWNRGEVPQAVETEDQERVSEESNTDNLLYVFAGPTWVWQSAQMKDGTVVSPKQPGKYTITFDSAEGRLIGVTDCNGFGGSYTSGAGNTLSFGPFMSTLMYCEGSQEAEFSDLVMNSYRYIFSESGDLVLILRDEVGAVIFNRQ